MKPAANIDGMRWSTIHDLLAQLIDATNAVQWTVAQANSRKTVPQPDPFPRPGRRKKTGMTQRSRDRINGWIRTSRIRPRPRGDADGR